MKSHIKPLMADPYGVPTGVVPRVFAPINLVELHDHETLLPEPAVGSEEWVRRIVRQEIEAAVRKVLT